MIFTHVTLYVLYLYCLCLHVNLDVGVCNKTLILASSPHLLDGESLLLLLLLLTLLLGALLHRRRGLHGQEVKGHPLVSLEGNKTVQRATVPKIS